MIKKSKSDDGDNEYYLIDEGCGCCTEYENVTKNSKEDIENLVKHLEEQMEMCNYILDCIVKR